jgi:sarcosine oxidase
MKSAHSYDTAVIGAGVFGAWTAHELQRAGQAVVLLDAYGAANSRASSGGESRIIRMSYGADEIYTRWAARALPLWQELNRQAQPPLFQRTGVLWLAPAREPYLQATLMTLQTVGVAFEKLTPAELAERFPQLALDEELCGIYEPDSGVIMARRAVQTLVRHLIERGVTYLPEAVSAPSGTGRLNAIRTARGLHISAANFVFACGPWLPKIFPDLLGDVIRPTRQEVFFFGVPAGDERFGPTAMPAWMDFKALLYALPDLEGRGVKLAIDQHGPEFDPDAGERRPSEEGLAAVRTHLARRLPSLRTAPLVEARVCQYENTPHGDLLLDRHPALTNVWLAGGGSGHGFKHGPSVGAYMAQLLTTARPVSESRFTLAAQRRVRQRMVY